MSSPIPPSDSSLREQSSHAPDNVTLPDRSRHAMLQMIWAALGSEVIAIFIMVFIVSIGYARAQPVAIWAPLSMAASLAALVAVSFGWCRRVSYSGWTAAQIAWSMASTVACYAMTGPLRAIVLPLTCLALVFSIFSLPARTVRWLASYVLVLFTITMTVMTLRHPDVYRWQDEFATFAILVLSLPMFALLASRMSTLRARLLNQKKQLKHALEKIQQLAITDELTGLFNRRYMLDALTDAQARAANGHGVFVAMIDLDRFKAINDTYGHSVGDDVLRSFAQVARISLRESETIGRWGGEEFILVVNTGDPAAARSSVERIRREIEQTCVTVAGGDSVSYTVSAGLSRHAGGEPIMDCVDRADRALYEAKTAGRNRIVGVLPVRTAETAVI